MRSGKVLCGYRPGLDCDFNVVLLHYRPRISETHSRGSTKHNRAARYRKSARAQQEPAQGLPAAGRRCDRKRPRAQVAFLHQPGARLRRIPAARQGHPGRNAPAQHRDCLGLQRHAFRAPADAGLSRADQAGRARSQCRGAVRRRRTRNVRRCDPGPARHGAFTVQPRYDRAVGGGRAVAQQLRRGAVSRRLRQDRAGPVDGGAQLRPPARDLRTRGSDDFRPAER